MKLTFQTRQILQIVGGHFIHDTYTAFVSPLLPLLIERLSLTLTQAGSLSVFLQLPALLNVFIGYMADKISLHYFHHLCAWDHRHPDYCAGLDARLCAAGDPAVCGWDQCGCVPCASPGYDRSDFRPSGGPGDELFHGGRRTGPHGGAAAGGLGGGDLGAGWNLAAGRHRLGDDSLPVLALA